VSATPPRTTAEAPTTSADRPRDTQVAAAPPSAATTAPVLAPTPAAIAPTAPPADTVRRDAELDLLGGPASGSMVTRTIVIRPDTRYVNVTGGEVIRFEVGDRSFVWNFNGTRDSFDLARVAPPSLLDRPVTAYVAPNPLYPRRR
jgi:hypothetical protein